MLLFALAVNPFCRRARTIRFQINRGRRADDRRCHAHRRRGHHNSRGWHHDLRDGRFHDNAGKRRQRNTDAQINAASLGRDSGSKQNR